MSRMPRACPMPLDTFSILAYTVCMNTLLDIPGLDERLKDRYQVLVQEHSGHAHPVAAGPRCLPREEAASAAQAAWRFYRNRRTTPARLAQPLLQAARLAADQSCDRFALIMNDWSHLDYRSHSDKKDTIQLGNKEEMGYEFFSSLLVSDRDGQPLAPVYQSLQAAAGVYSSQDDLPQPPQSQLDALAPILNHVQQMHLARTPVFFVDAEADSVFHYRLWDEQQHLFVVRADEQRVARFEKQTLSFPTIVELLRQRQQFQQVREVDYKGKKVQQYVAEAAVVLTRSAQLNREVDGVRKRIYVPGKALSLRLVVSELRDEAGNVLARWLLLTNVPADVSAATVALWYYWRWQIESYFKLLKGAGQQVEHWQQETGQRILKRLLVASMACVLVWQLARSVAPEAKAARRLLMRLSGRQLEWGKEFTEEALLAGLWVLLAMLDVLEEEQPSDLRHLGDFILSGSGCGHPQPPTG
jgi:hypothetical protein